MRFLLYLGKYFNKEVFILHDIRIYFFETRISLSSRGKRLLTDGNTKLKIVKTNGFLFEITNFPMLLRTYRFFFFEGAGVFPYSSIGMQLFVISFFFCFCSRLHPCLFKTPHSKESRRKRGNGGDNRKA